MPRLAALETLRRVDRGARAREVLDAVLQRRSLADRDRDLARELVQGALRHQDTIDHLLGAHTKRPLEKAHAADRAALRMGAHQILFLDRVPARAAVHSTVDAVKAAGRPRAAGFVNAVLRALAGSLDGEPTAEPGPDPRRAVPRGDGTWRRFTAPVLPDPAEDEAGWLAAAWSHPRWLVERLLSQHGAAEVRQVLAAGIARPAVALRPTPGHADELLAALTVAGVDVEPEGRCLLVRGGGPVSGLPGFTENWFRVQDPTAADVVPMLELRPGEGVLDLCAAPGGKTVAIAEAVGPDGVVLAVDLPGPRTASMEREIRRLGLTQVGVLALDATDPDLLPRGLVGRPTPGFDAVLVDVPCSNTGVLAQRVEARGRLEGPHRVAMLAEQALHLLMVAASRVRPGGRLLYSTCSIDREENEDVVAAFLAEDAHFLQLAGETVLPVPGRRGGGHHALLRHRG